ncbi:RHS repeat-associated core domain-containing protein [Stenotrophomonas sp. SAM-B]|uniref:RHS repeat-associated core domain-containing protein n=1 Tax=Stenotrophomonas sp. SAM-B TaxID=2729141 RepID=UPI0015A0A27B|nr:RHS repeat-associated core domain-containing protein [Stenotrophomonas sp. SAM-B]
MSHDALDNLRTWTQPGEGRRRYDYDGSNRLTVVRNAGGAAIIGLGYDVQGNLLIKNGQGYQFDFGNRLRVATSLERYRYDGHGRRSSVIDAGSGKHRHYLYSQGGALAYLWDQGRGERTQYIQLAGSLVAARKVAGSGAVSVRYQHTDALGSPVAETNEQAAVVLRTAYTPYGASIGAAQDGVGYTGHVMDGSTGLTYMQQRYMDPTVGVFLSVDPVAVDLKAGGKFNRYSYVLGNPYKFTDPDGRDEEWFSNVDQMGNPGFGNELGDDAFHYNGTALATVALGGFTLPGIIRSIAAPFTRAMGSEIGGPTVGGVRVGNSPADTRSALEGAGHKGVKISNDSGTESGTLHNVPSMKMDVRVMDGGPKHEPRVSVTREGHPRQPVNPENGRNFGNIPRAEQRTGSHIFYRKK